MVESQPQKKTNPIVAPDGSQVKNKNASPKPDKVKESDFLLQAYDEFYKVVLTWVLPTDIDIKHIEVWCAEGSNSRAAANLVTKTTGSTFSHDNLTLGTQYYYWIRSADTSGLFGSQ